MMAGGGRGDPGTLRPAMAGLGPGSVRVTSAERLPPEAACASVPSCPRSRHTRVSAARVSSEPCSSRARMDWAPMAGQRAGPASCCSLSCSCWRTARWYPPAWRAGSEVDWWEPACCCYCCRCRSNYSSMCWSVVWKKAPEGKLQVSVRNLSIN